MVHNKLLTNANRVRCGLSVDSRFMTCNYGNEDMLHLLRDCQKTKGTWLALCALEKDDNLFCHDRNSLFFFLQYKQLALGFKFGWQVQNHLECYFVVSCQLSWKQRCKSLFDAKFVFYGNPSELIFNYVVEMIMQCVNMSNNPVKVNCWLAQSALHEDYVKLNTDVASGFPPVQLVLEGFFKMTKEVGFQGCGQFG